MVKIEWLSGEPNTPEERLKNLSKIPLEVRLRLNRLGMIYGQSFLILNKDGSYTLYYPNSEGELVEDE